MRSCAVRQKPETGTATSPKQKTENSSSLYLKNDAGTVIGSVCINFDISGFLLMENMTRNDKIKMVEFLDSKGTFLINKAGDRICEYLDISKFTLYNYLNLLKKQMSHIEANGESAK